MRKVLAIIGLIVSPASFGEAYEICIKSDSDPVCFTLDTPLPKADIVAVANYPNGNVEINIAGVDANLRCKDTNNDGFDDECVLAIQAADSPYHANGAVLNAVCAGTTLLETVADGFNRTFTRPTYNSDQCGYTDPDPCYSGSWYTGYGNPQCEDPTGTDTSPSYREVCPSGSSGEYVLMTPGSCL